MECEIQHHTECHMTGMIRVNTSLGVQVIAVGRDREFARSDTLSVTGRYSVSMAFIFPRIICIHSI